jgi:hypothetical protein
VVEGSIDPDIYAEFLFHVRDKEQNHMVRLVKAINLLESKYSMVILIVRFIEIERKVQERVPGFESTDHEQIWKVLSSIIPCKKTDPLQTILTRASRLLNERKNKEAELSEIRNISEGGKADRSYFTRLIASVGSHHKMQINRSTMLLCEFVEYLILMREYQQEMERQLNKK